MTWQQQWLDVLFLHFPAPAAALEPHVPTQVEIDCLDGQTWVSYVFFRLNLRVSGLPFVPGLSSLLELNVRTYVRHRGQAGIYFLRMYADNRLAIHAARLLTPLRYQPAEMLGQTDNGSRRIECRPTHEPQPLLRCDYRIPTSFKESEPRSLDSWLLERYRLYVEAADGSLLAADVQHVPWPAATVSIDGIAHAPCGAWGLAQASTLALAHHSPGVAARFRAFATVAASGSPAGAQLIFGQNFVASRH